jgi:hypothetical protein
VGKQLRAFGLGWCAENMLSRAAIHPDFTGEYQQHRRNASHNARLFSPSADSFIIHKSNRGPSREKALIEKSAMNIDLIDVAAT